MRIAMINRFKTTVFVALIGLATPTAAQDIIFVVHERANDTFRTVVKNGAEAAAKDVGANVKFLLPKTFDAAGMSRMIDTAAKRKPDGLVVSIPDDDIGPAVERAVAAGIPVISIDSGSSVSKRVGALLHVEQDDYAAGKAAGAKLAKMGGKNAICVGRYIRSSTFEQRCGGFAAGFGGIVEEIFVDGDPTEIQAKISVALESNPDIDALMALNASAVGEPAVAAVKALERPNVVHIGAFDMSDGFLRSVANGEAAFAVDQQRFLQGYLPVTFLALYAKFGLIPGGNVPAGPNLITADKVERVISLSAKGVR